MGNANVGVGTLWEGRVGGERGRGMGREGGGCGRGRGWGEGGGVKGDREREW